MLADGADSHRAYLTDALAAGVNLSFGAFDGDRAGRATSSAMGSSRRELPGQTGDVLYVEDFAVVPSSAGSFRNSSNDSPRRHGNTFPVSALEAHSLDSVLRSGKSTSSSVVGSDIELVPARADGRDDRRAGPAPGAMGADRGVRPGANATSRRLLEKLPR